jgi:hypothetical protein
MSSSNREPPCHTDIGGFVGGDHVTMLIGSEIKNNHGKEME